MAEIIAVSLTAVRAVRFWNGDLMAAKFKSDSHLEIAHVLFIDVVGYSKLLATSSEEWLNNSIELYEELLSSGKAKGPAS